jgi:hypothetical protein
MHLQIITASLVIYLLSFIYTRIASSRRTVEGLDEKKLKFYRCTKFPVNKITEKIFEKEGIVKVDSPKDADIYIPCGYNDVEKEYKTIPKSEFIYAIQGCDSIVSKSKLWELLSRYYGRPVAATLVPETYLLTSQDDRIRVLASSPEKIFIAKKNLQRQEGIVLIKKQDLTIKKLNQMKADKFVVIQEYLADPYTINGHKINVRVYLLLVIKDNKLSGYTYDDGFIYYTKEKYAYSTDKDQGITTGYIDRSIYDANPLTHKDFDKHLVANGKTPSLLYKNIDNVISKVIKACESSLSGNATKCNYQLFGIDIQPDKNLNVKLIEINKGPSLRPMDDRDRSVKHKLQEDLYSTIGITKASPSSSTTANGFTKIY